MQVAQAPKPPQKGAAHLTAFENDLKSRTDTFTRSRSSTLGLLNHLEATKNAPVPFKGANDAQKLADAKSKCANAADKRLTKYEPALRALVRVWGTNNDYKPEVGGSTTSAPVSSGSRDGDIKIANTVCQGLLDVKIADVDFSEGVRTHAKAKKFGGRTLYDIVKKEFEGQPLFHKHEAVLFNAKVSARQAHSGISLGSLDAIAKFVTDSRFAVCESITATVISKCKSAGFGGRMEWIGISYGGKRGHSIVVAHRKGQLDDPSTWGNYFVIDLWYYNLDMRKAYLIEEATARSNYCARDITPYLKNGLKQMADIT
jgi:hypothetical protein